jgi:hypothetical protein
MQKPTFCIAKEKKLMTREQPRKPTPATLAMRERMKSDGVSPARYVAEQLLRGEKVPDMSEWIALAACGSQGAFNFDLDIPSPDANKPEYSRKVDIARRVQFAKQVCSMCSAQYECLASQLGRGQDDDSLIVGGTTKRQREAARRWAGQVKKPKISDNL